MKIEMDDETQIALLISAGLILIASCIIGCTAIAFHTDNLAIKAGLVQEQNVGTSGYHWVKGPK